MSVEKLRYKLCKLRDARSSLEDAGLDNSNSVTYSNLDSKIHNLERHIREIEDSHEQVELPSHDEIEDMGIPELVDTYQQVLAIMYDGDSVDHDTDEIAEAGDVRRQIIARWVDDLDLVAEVIHAINAEGTR